MKKIVVIITLAFLPIIGFGQGIFEKYEDMEGITSGSVKQKAFSMLASMEIDLDNPEEQEIFEAIKKITGARMLISDNTKVSKMLETDVNKYIKKSNLEELMTFKDGGKVVNFYVKEGKDEYHVDEFLMFVNGLKEITQNSNIEINGKKREVEAIYVSIVGDVDLRQVSRITNKMNLKGSEYIKDVPEKKN